MIGGQSNHTTNTRKNIDDIAVLVVIRSVVLSFNVFFLILPSSTGPRITMPP